MPFLLVWIVIPYAFDIHGNNLDAVKETAKQYLGQIHRVKPLPINPSKLNRLTHLIVQRNLAEYQELVVSSSFGQRQWRLYENSALSCIEILLMLWLVIIATTATILEKKLSKS